jgi:hypothetical protein
MNDGLEERGFIAEDMTGVTKDSVESTLGNQECKAQ